MICKETDMRAVTKLGTVIAAVGLLAAASAMAQYKYVGPDGRVVYSDQPPPPGAKGVQKPATAAAASSGGTSAGLPYALQQATKSFPVTLYTTSDCDACNQGRNLLNKRGIPFAEKTVRTPEDIKIFKEATKAEQVPVMMIGSNRQVGFEEGAWNGALTVAGYPPNNVLPAGFKNAPALPAAPFSPEAPKTATGPANGTADKAGPAASTAPTAGAPSLPADRGRKPPSWFKGF
jgi:hypothetical protein